MKQLFKTKAICFFTLVTFSLSTSAPLTAQSAITRIHDIQGTALTSTRTGQNATVEGVIVGIIAGGNGQLAGFFVMEEDTDADQNKTTSEGIYVYAPGNTGNAIGDKVRVTGTVQEFNKMTQIGFVTATENLGRAPAGLPTPAPVLLPVDEVSDWEHFEGMRVVFQQPLVVTDLYNIGRYNEILVATQRLDNPTNVVTPGAPANILSAANAKSKIIIDDELSAQNPRTVRFLSDSIQIRRGATLLLTGTVGVLSEEFDAYRIRIPLNVKIPVGNVPARPLVPAVGGRLQVATFNLLNLFSTLNQGGAPCGPLEDECRGADTQPELDRQLNKIIAAILSLNAEIIGLQEVENHATGDATLQLLKEKLNAAMGTQVYDFVATGALGPQVIKVAILYRKDRVQPVGRFSTLTSTVDRLFSEKLNRAALAQTFKETATNEVVTIVVNHLKSKGPSTSVDAADVDAKDADLGDGQAFFNAARAKAATALVKWIATDPTKSNDPDFLIVGDLNSYRREEPITTFEQGGFQNVLVTRDANPYSFVYFGEAGQLDYILANASAAAQITGAGVWHVNSDEPNALNYNNFNQNFLYKADAFRASDHDPVLIGLNLSSSGSSSLPIATKTNKDIGKNVRFSKDTIYVLEGFVYVENGETLNIDAGATIRLKKMSDERPSALIITKGGKIVAQGTPTQPIIFINEAMPQSDAQCNPFDTSKWIGLLVLGEGTLNSVQLR